MVFFVVGFCFYFFAGTGAWIQCFTLAQQALYQLSHSTSPKDYVEKLYSNNLENLVKIEKFLEIWQTEIEPSRYKW
jgi:hypothetical protein